MVVKGFIDNVNDYMDAADLVITKPGGLTSSEALAKRKPLVLMDPLPGVESRNLGFLVNNSLAVYANKYMNEDEVVMQLLSNEERLRVMRETQEKLGKRHSAKRLGRFYYRPAQKIVHKKNTVL